jgi:hypothetical protein
VLGDPGMVEKPGSSPAGGEPARTTEGIQPTGAERPQEAAPERFGLGLPDVQADHFPPARLVDPIGDHQGLVAHPAGLADPLHLRTC